ncbi:signal peptide peptidase SppA [Aquincola sp. J276]|uniref:signal peptide peptidase SppA n=1 Tax=Aquincola sp. J276 TaxID=2898432 RepID=UPI002150E0E3|nr:signal peptide peptidase SppA [Aquincola sp. J276]MCR5867006.1 signal peptide peptidase SppA [Aquincola sp. J276]
MNPHDDAPAASGLPPHDAAPHRPAAPAVATLRAAGLESAVEQLADGLLRERRSERRWRVFFRIVWLAITLAVLYALFVQRVQHVAPAGPHTALVEVRGEIAADAEASAENINAALKSAFEDANAQAVVLRINSPGGSPVQAGMVYDEIRRLKAKHGKKVYAVVEEICASGAYYIAVAADEVYVDKASIVGSIGVLMDGFGFTGLMEKLGVERRLITAGENKGMLDPFSPLSERQRALAQSMIDQIHQQFIAVVKEGRGQRLKETPDIFSGLFWNGEQSVQLGLADHMGTLDYVAREVVKAEEVVDYTPKDNVAERLAKRFGAAMGEGAVKALRAFGPLR